MTTTKQSKKSAAESRFDSFVAQMERRGYTVEIETNAADACFGERKSASIFHAGKHGCGYVFAAMTLHRSGGICRQRTSVTTYSAIDGVKADWQSAMIRLNMSWRESDSKANF